MNERIRELAEVADQLAEDELLHLERVHNRLYSFTEGREIYNQKFAELIVAECVKCADIVGRANLASGYPNSTAHHVKQKIQEHFGVEE